MANIKEYSKEKDGEKNVEKDFKLKEFACHDGSDYFKIDNDLFPILQRFRDYVESPVEISSAYRNEEYNREVGGANGSYHVKGQAVDIPFNDDFKYLLTPYMMGEFFRTLRVPSIIVYDWGVHIDTRDYIQYLEQRDGEYYDLNLGKINVPLYNLLQKGSSGTEVGCLQFMLQKLGYEIEVDEIFGEKTDMLVRDFQQIHNLLIDGIVGDQTWEKLINV